MLLEGCGNHPESALAKVRIGWWQQYFYRDFIKSPSIGSLAHWSALVYWLIGHHWLVMGKERISHCTKENIQLLEELKTKVKSQRANPVGNRKPLRSVIEKKIETSDRAHTKDSGTIENRIWLCRKPTLNAKNLNY